MKEEKLMPEICPRCERPIAPESPRGLCPVCCLLDLGFGSQTSVDDEEVPGVELGIVLGEGSFGQVYEGIELHAGYRRVAVKILRGEVQGAAQRARFLEEIQVLALLNHPHIATILGSGRTSAGNPFYLMELVEGETLDRWAAEQTLSERLRVLRQATSAVAHAHQKGIAHRDLKPTNILVESASGQAKVIDFGIARAFEGPASWARNETVRGQRMGSPFYMSPEQLAGDPHVDLRTDIWSLGLLLYQLTLGKTLLSEVLDAQSSWEENSQRLRDFDFPKLPDRELDWIARKACALDPEERYPTGQALLQDLEAKEKNEAVSVGLSYRGYRFRKSLARHRLGYALTGAGLLLLLTLAMGGWLLSARDRIATKTIAHKHEQALAAEATTRRVASDNALLAGTRAMDSQDFAQAQRSLDQALELWPENTAAIFTKNYLQATMPAAELEDRVTLPHGITNVHPLGDGTFLLLSKEGQNYRYQLGEELTVSEERFPEKPEQEWQDRERSLKVSLSSKGILSFQDLSTGFAVMSPLVFGSGLEKAAYSTSSGHILVVDGTTTISLWNLARLRQGFQQHQMKSPVLWLDFEKENGRIWMTNEKGTIFAWKDKGGPTWAMQFPGGNTSHWDHWLSGEAHSRGMPSGTGGLKGVMQISSWALDGGKTMERSAKARENDTIVALRSDGSVWIQEVNQFFEKVSDFKASTSALAIDSNGELVIHVSQEGKVQPIDARTLSLQPSWSLPQPAEDISLLDTGELVVAHSDGTVTVWNLTQTNKPLLTIQAVESIGRKPHVRAVPGQTEFVYALDGDVSLRHFSAQTGKQIGASMRHQHQVHWICFSDDPDIFFTIDQADSGPGTLRVWSLRLAREIVPGIEHPDQILWATILGQSNRIATSCSDGSVRRWILTNPNSAKDSL